MIEIYWTGTDAKGFTDLIPEDWFEDESTQDREHSVLSRNRTYFNRARCSVKVRAADAILDYSGRHSRYNDEHGMQIGQLKFKFFGNDVCRLADVYWRSEGSQFEPAPVMVKITGDLFDEGNPELLLHMDRERSRKLHNQKINDVKSRGQQLKCEACQFLFFDKYGEIGKDFCEVHHRVQLSVTGRRLVSPSDLAIMCSNCHRMIHRTKPMMTVEEFAARHVRSV